MSYHDPLTLKAGDDWNMSGKLVDAAGKALDLTTAEISWLLLDTRGQVIPASLSLSVVKIAPFTSGQVTIPVPASLTTQLMPGRYFDAVMVTLPGARAEMWWGAVDVDASPFNMVSIMSPSGVAVGSPDVGQGV